jgi:threonine dehydrogenase-like Zn-dependent dehydrogenase
VRVIPSYTYGHHHGEREFEEAAHLLAAHPELSETIVTHRFPLADAPAAFRTAADRSAGAIKVVIEP